MKQGSTRPKISIATVRNLIIGTLAVFFVFSAGYCFGKKSYTISRGKGANVTITREQPQSKEDVSFGLFWQTWDALEAKYFDQDKLIDENLLYGAISGMVASVGDPYTVFLPPQQNKVVREDLNGSFEGVGIQIGFRDNQLAVIAPLADSPAEKAGVKAGDYIVGITDIKKEIERGTSGISLHEAVQTIRGEAGSIVTLTVVREGENEPLEIDVKRASIDVPTITLKYAGENDQYAHVKLNRFGGETVDEWEDIVSEILINKDVDGIIVDLRNNPGGYLQAANDIASDFLEMGDTIVIEEDGQGNRTEYTVDRLARFKDINTVVLLNEGSASASEILAGALRDNADILLIGENSFGKGTIQEPQQINGGSGLHITIAKWLTPDGMWVNEVGLEPDTIVEDDLETETDEQLEKAIESLKQ